MSSKRRSRQEEGHENNERWLLTYSDLITLLMIFFIIMYAMSNVSVNISERGVVISLKDTVLFESGSTAIKSENANALIEIGKTLKSVDKYVRIEGNTDNIPISNSDFKDNWELSVMRSAKVLQLIVEQSGFPPSKISAVGYGEYRPAAPNDSLSNKAKNRRVDIVILNERSNRSESE